MHGPGLLTFTVNGLKIIEAAFACDLALELLQSVERHARGIGSN